MGASCCTVSKLPAIAETLNIRQSTLSRRLRDLELQLGAMLFRRTNGGTKPTAAGQEFLDAAGRVLD